MSNNKKTDLMPSVRQTKRNIWTIWFNRTFLILIPLITTPLITNYFGLKITAIWLLALQFSSQLMLLDVGVTNSLVRLLAMRKAVENSEYAANIITTTFYILYLTGGLLIIFSPLLSSAYVSLFNIPNTLLTESRNLILLSVLSVGIVLPMRIGYGILASKHRFDKIQYIDTIGNAVKLILIVILFSFGNPSLFSLGSIVFGISVIISIATFISALLYSDISQKTFHWRLFSKPVLILLLSMGVAALVVTFSSVLLHQGTSSLVGYVLDLHSVSLLALPLMIYISITPFFQTFATIASPMAASISTVKEREVFFSNYIQSTKYLVSISFLMVISFLFIGESILGLWLLGPKVNAEEIHIMNTVLTLLFIGYSLGLPASIGRSILASVGRHWSSSITELWTTLVGVGVGGLLVYTTDLKLIGMVLGIILAMSLKGLYAYPKLLAKYFGCSPGFIVINILLMPTLIALPFICFGLINNNSLISLSSFSINLNLNDLILVWVVSIIVITSVMWRLIINPEHKKIMTKFILNRF